ncbi:hypothetical protein SAMN05421819_3762 [Bryocella elongata]|uniref:Uncharacterized protein n=1 Tax=Bryocella elongata TaxID=863522 RepID=A0A1H6BJN6_9BACT|nr:hypothetical protein [Bryocella elongata]SEG60903.1 hypothetical protein SAMN05421819_3762 [Bryocella elongata]
MTVDWLLSPLTIAVELDFGLQFEDLLNRRTKQMLGRAVAARQLDLRPVRVA